MILFLEGLAMCFIILIVCVIGIAFDGPVGLVTFYEPEVQEKVIALGLITRKKITRNAVIAGIFVFLPMVLFIPYIVYGINGARGFTDGLMQMLVLGMMYGLFDRLFIDWFWVGKTNAWNIPGTEEFKPYIPKKTLLKKWIGTLVVYPLFYVLVAWIMSLLLK
ncbi:MAG: hypothetical protein IKN55_05870 [Oscillospiraceae bacterium]|nr:hypothetical protein [Oscillospiraceae bacterium]